MIKKEEIVAQAASLRFSLSEINSYVAIFGAGVIIGFISRRFFSLVLLSLLISLIIVKGLELQNVLKIDWTMITSYLGFDTNVSLGEVFKDIYDLAAQNVYLTITAVTGFLIGYRAG